MVSLSGRARFNSDSGFKIYHKASTSIQIANEVLHIETIHVYCEFFYKLGLSLTKHQAVL